MSGIAGGIARLQDTDRVRAERRLAIQKLGQERLGSETGLPNLPSDLLDRINQYQISMGMGSRRELTKLEDAKREGTVEPFADQGTQTMINMMARIMTRGVVGTNARGGGGQ